MQPNTRIVSETNTGLYVWELPDGRWVGDEDGNWMHIVSRRGDLARINMLADAAKAHGVFEGHAVFLENIRPVSDEEYEIQRQRLRFGLVPDELDRQNIIDDLKNGK